MKLHATLKNERGGKKSTSDDTRILVELTYKNKTLGTIGLYTITEEGQDAGYRIVWNEEGKGFDPNQKPLLEKYTPQQGNITCSCGSKFYGLEGKEDTCRECLREIMQKGNTIHDTTMELSF